MLPLNLNHKNLCSSLKLTDTKANALKSAQNIKYRYSDKSEHINNLCLELQKKLNQGKLNEQDLIKFISQLKDNNFSIQDAENLVNDIMILAKHDTNFETKINWFGITNKTASLSNLIHATKNIEQNSTDIKQIYLAQQECQAVIKSILAICYNDVNYLMESQNIYSNLANNTTNALKIHGYEDQYFQVSNMIEHMIKGNSISQFYNNSPEVIDQYVQQITYNISISELNLTRVD